MLRCWRLINGYYFRRIAKLDSAIQSGDHERALLGVAVVHEHPNIFRGVNLSLYRDRFRQKGWESNLDLATLQAMLDWVGTYQRTLNRTWSSSEQKREEQQQVRRHGSVRRSLGF